MKKIKKSLQSSTFSSENTKNVVIVYDHCVAGLTDKNVFPEDCQVLTVENLGLNSESDPAIMGELKNRFEKCIFVTADKGNDLYTPDPDRTCIVRFSNNNDSTDSKAIKLARLQKTKPFRSLLNWFGKKRITLGLNAVRYEERGILKKRKLSIPFSLRQKLRGQLEDSSSPFNSFF